MLKDDLIKGAAAASLYSGIGARCIYDLCAKDAIPFARIGGRLFFRKSELDQTFSGKHRIERNK